MKKITYLLLALVLAIGTLTACGSSDKESGTKRYLMIMFSQTTLLKVVNLMQTISSTYLT